MYVGGKFIVNALMSLVLNIKFIMFWVWWNLFLQVSQSVPFHFYRHFKSWFHLSSIFYFQLLFYEGYFGVWKIWAEEEKKINLEVLKSSAISIKCLEFVKIIWKFEFYEKICYCQVEKVIIFITKIAKYFWHLNNLIHSLFQTIKFKLIWNWLYLLSNIH